MFKKKYSSEMVFDSNSDWLFIVDLNCMILYSNKKVKDIIGFNKDKIINKNFCKLIYKSDENINNCPILKMIKTKKRVRSEFFLEEKSNWYEITSDPIFDENKNLTMSINIVREKKEYQNFEKQFDNEKEMEDSINKYQLIFEGSNDAIFLHDIDNGNIVGVNKKACEMYGFNKDELIGLNIYDLSANDQKINKNIFKKGLKNIRNSKKNYEWHAKDKKGNIFWVEVNPNIIKIGGKERLLVTVRNIDSRKKAEEALQESERFLQNIFDGIAEGLSVLDEDFNIIQVNKWMQNMYSHKNNLVGKKCYSAYQDRESICPWCPSIVSFKTGNKKSNEVPYPNEKNPEGWINLTAYPLKNKKGEVIGIIESVQDITKQKKVQAEKERIEMDMKNTVKGLPGHVFRVKKEDKGNFIFILSEGHIASNFNLTTDKIGGLSLKEISNTKDYTKIKKHYIEAFRGKESTFDILLREKYWFRTNLIPYELDKYGNVKEIIGYSVDITEKKHAEEKLRESEEKSKRFFELSSDLVCEYNFKNNNFTKINPAFSKVLGYKEKEILNKSIFDFLHPDDFEKTKMIINKKIEKGYPIISFINRYRCKNDTYRWFEWSAKPLIKEGVTYAIARDITERKKQEQILKKQMMKYNIEEGNIYLVKEKTLNVSLKAFRDVLDIGYYGLMISRNLNNNYNKYIKNNYRLLWLSEKKIKNSIKPDVKNIQNIIEKQNNKTVIFIDRLDYILTKNNYNKTLDLIQKIREIAILKNLIVIISIDCDTIDKKYFRLIEKETLNIEPISRKKLTKNMQNIIDYIHKQNTMGIYPRYKDIEIEMKISKPTLRSKIKWLVKNNYIIVHKEGRSKNIEITDKSRSMYL